MIVAPGPIRCSVRLPRRRYRAARHRGSAIGLVCRLVNRATAAYHAHRFGLSEVAPFSDVDQARMKPKLQRTFTPKPTDLDRQWWLIDAAGAPLGRVATEAATLLRGKHKPKFAPHFDGGDYVVVVNVEKIGATGNKDAEKRYYRHSGYPGGLREMTLGAMRKRYPERIIEAAVRGMLPRNKLGRRMIGRLKAYGGQEHPHSPQNPQLRDLVGVRRIDS